MADKTVVGLIVRLAAV